MIQEVPAQRIWEGLHQKLAAALTTTALLPFLVDVLECCHMYPGKRSRHDA
jgi:hypothetical protein